MTRRIVRRALPAAVILLALGLSACAPGTPAADDDAADPTTTASPEPSASATAEPTASPTAPAGIAATCDTVLTPEAYEKIEADGLEPTPFTPFDPLAIRITDEGGLTCAWGRPQTDLLLDVAQLPVGDDEATWIDALAQAGYTRTDDPVPGAYTGQPEAGNGITPVAIVADGTITFVSLPAFAGWVRPAS